LFVIFMVLFAAPAFAAVGSSCPDGILSYWKLDDPDSSPSYVDYISGFNGGCDGGCPKRLADGDSVVDEARSFSGGAGILVPRQAAFDWSADASFSIELWVRRSPKELNNEEVLIARTDGSLRWSVALNDSGKIVFELKDKNGSGPDKIVGQKTVATTLAGVARWHHVVAVRDGEQNKNILYVDGEEEGSADFDYAGGFSSDTAGITMGWTDAADQERFSGDLDEIAIYSRALSVEEIRGHYFLAKGYCSLYDAKIKIMPLGDSITQGVFDGVTIGNSYRKDLYAALNDSLYWFDFVGGKQDGDFPDNDHDGWAQQTSSDIAKKIESNDIDVKSADVILLHIGTNDPPSSDVSGVVDILNNIDSVDKRKTIILAYIIDDIEEDHAHDLDVASFNDALEKMLYGDKDSGILGRINLGDKIIVVDMWHGAGLSYHTWGDMFNDLHPNISGFKKMADQWFVKLNGFLPMFELPEITSSPVTKATRGKKYQYDVQATGQPRPLYRLLQKADDTMTIDPASGLIEWTPGADSQSGKTVKVEAYMPEDKGNTGWANRSDTQEFTITLNSAPVARPENYGPVEGGKTLTATQWDGVLANDSDPDADDQLTAILVSDVSHGTLSLNQDGSFTYTHNGDDVTKDTFTYKASDGLDESNVVTVTFTINPVSTAGSASSSSGGGGCFIGSCVNGAGGETGLAMLAIAASWTGLSLLLRRRRKR